MKCYVDAGNSRVLIVLVDQIVARHLRSMGSLAIGFIFMFFSVTMIRP